MYPLTNLQYKDDASLIIMFQNCMRAIRRGGPRVTVAEQLINTINLEMNRRLARANAYHFTAETPSVGLLKTMGYSVGNNGETIETRREIIDYIMTKPLPPISSISYMASWGDPLSQRRYQKLCRTLESFVSNAHSRCSMDLACYHWEQDLLYIQEKWGHL
jgi:hypothetical protein